MFRIFGDHWSYFFGSMFCFKFLDRCSKHSIIFYSFLRRATAMLSSKNLQTKENMVYAIWNLFILMSATRKIAVYFWHLITISNYRWWRRYNKFWWDLLTASVIWSVSQQNNISMTLSIWNKKAIIFTNLLNNVECYHTHDTRPRVYCYFHNASDKSRSWSQLYGEKKLSNSWICALKCATTCWMNFVWRIRTQWFCSNKNMQCMHIIEAMKS